MPIVIIWILGCLCLAAESVVLSAFGVLGWTFQVPLALTIYLGLRREFVPGALTLAALLFPIEWFVGGAMGFYSLGLVVVFFSMRVLRGNIQPGWGIGHALVAGASAWLHGLIMIIGLVLLQSGSAMIASVFWSMWTAALTVAFTTVILGKMLDRLDRALDPRSGRGSLMHDF
ncbi:MAG: hypothetical protein ACNA8W_03855 [Bradymonadaceae bacterium]